MDQIKTGKFIAELRKEKNMTQLDLATRLGVTDRAVSKWENGRGLPDISLIKPLCESLDISVNELLSGERIAAEQTLEIANENMLGMLSDREREIKKRMRISVLCMILAVITVIWGIAYSIVYSSQIIAEARGDGYSLSAAKSEKKARKAAFFIKQGNYKRAVKEIGFRTKDRSESEKQWCNEMNALFEDVLEIEQFTIGRAIEDDEFISGDATLVVYDKESERKYIFDIPYAWQDGGITFARLYAYQFDDLSREAEIAELIDGALSTWYAG